MAAPHARLLKRLYQDTAPRYAAVIAPALAPLTALLLESLSIHPTDRVLDIGAGVGELARRVAPRARHVTALDFSAPMLAQARREAANIALTCADAHALPFPPAAFDVALAAFCLNETEPAAALAEARRVLRPGGRLALLEWGPADARTRLVDEVLAEHATDGAAGFQAEMRALAGWWRPWDEAVGSLADVAALLRAAGFTDVRCEEVVARLRFDDAGAFTRYALAWSPRRVEVDAMPPARRAAFERALRAALGEGALVWEPALFRAVAC